MAHFAARVSVLLHLHPSIIGAYNHINSNAVIVKQIHFLSCLATAWQVEDLLDAFRCEVSDTDSGSEGPSELEEGAADSRSQGRQRLEVP